MINKISNIDTIYILVNIKNYEISCKKILQFLENEKEKAKLKLISDANSKHLITINEIPFELLSNGTRGYAYILHNDGYEVKIAQYKSKIKSFMPIQIRITSEYLWSKGLNKAWETIYKWIELTFGNIEENKVSRVDVCMHTSDVDYITNYENSYKGKFKKESINGLNYTHKKVNAIMFGTRKGKNIYCRIYNKTLEIKETKKKSWFIDIWKRYNLDIDNVWNLEFELKSEFLREFKIKTVGELENSLKDIWEYCTKEWLVKIERTNKRVERCKIDEKWLEIQKAYEDFKSKGLIKREKQLQLDADTLIPNIVGNITSYAARKNITNMNSAFQDLYNSSKRYLEIKQTDFERETKIKLHQLKENGGK